VILGLFLGIQAYLQRDMAQGQAPPLRASLLSGDRTVLADHAGEAVLLHFWATWCPVCRLEHGSIDRLAEDHQVITVAIQSGAEAEIRGFMDEHELDFPVIADPDGRLAARYGVKGVPASFFIDGDGRIAFRTRGYTTGWGLRARLWLTARGLH